MLKDKTFDLMFFGFLIVFGITLIIGSLILLKPKKADAHWELTKDARQKIENEVLGVDNGTDFVPAYYESVVSVYDDIPLDAEQQIFVSNQCEKYNISPELIYSLMFHESTYKADALNGNCKGIMQINTSVHKIENPFDFYENVETGIKYLSELFEKYEEVDLVLAKWHGESKAQENYEKGEISGYVRKVLSMSEQLEREHGK